MSQNLTLSFDTNARRDFVVPVGPVHVGRGKPAARRPGAEDVLREMAFVLRAVRTVRDAMTCPAKG